MDSKLVKIKVNNVSWKVGSKNILDEVGITFYEGKIYGLLGPNGAGKTSLVRTLMGFIKPAKGEILYDEKAVNKLNRNDIARLVSFLPQSLSCNIDLPVFDVVSMGREPYRKTFKGLDETDIALVEEAMKFTNCSHLRDKNINKLSGGELQRVMIARTIAQDTPWIILDEPIASLDVKHQVDLVKVLKRLKDEKGKTIIIIFHDINLAASLCDEVALMKKGRIELNGQVEEILTAENLAHIFEIEFKSIGQQEHYLIPDFYSVRAI